MSMSVGSSTLALGPNGYEISAALHERQLTAHLTLTPRTLPLVARTNAAIGTGQISWLMLPRLTATGTVVVNSRVHRLKGVPAYHDHNWGHWRWGENFSWQWGFGIPDDDANPWTVVFQRLSDRTRGTTVELIMALWRGAELYRLFQQPEINISPIGFASVRPVLKLPRVLSLVAPEHTTDAPERLLVTAESGRDRVHMTLDTCDLAQIVVPNESNLGVTLINEVRGHLCLQGCVKGHEIAATGEGFYEFLT
jgi:hypothetical protein